MNTDIDFNSKKFALLLLVILILFFILIMKAFQYLPDATNKNEYTDISQLGINTIAQSDNVNNTQEGAKNADVEQTENNDNKKKLNVDISGDSDYAKFETIDEPVGVNPTLEVIDEPVSGENTDGKSLTSEEKAIIALNKADNYRVNAKYTEALNEYRKVSELTSENSLVASSYEGIAEVYAASKRYGTALSFASKAYNLSPSSNREILLARLYYKTGDIDKATKRVNNVLHRDFSDDR